MTKPLSKLGRATVLTFLRAFGAPVATVSAHPLDELLQLIYVTPTATGVTIEVQITPGELIASEFAMLVDMDGDGTISDDEAAKHLETVRGAISVRFGETAVPVTLMKSSYPDAASLRAGGGTIMALFAADSPTSEAGERVVSVTHEYSPMSTVVQTSVTLSAYHVVDVTSIQRADEGRVLTLRYAERARV